MAKLLTSVEAQKELSLNTNLNQKTENISDPIRSFLNRNVHEPLFLVGDSISVLRRFPNDSVDCCITSPPYWGKREYRNGGLGQEDNYKEFISELAAVFSELHRVLKPTGSFWLNIGDTYLNKRLLGIPWRLALVLQDQQGWTLRNCVVWNKIKGGLDNTNDRLRNVHEPIFHFVKDPYSYYYDVDAIRSTPRKARIINGAVISATGVSGVRYKRQIELSSSLTESEKKQAMAALTAILSEVSRGNISDFRMIIRGQQRTTHSESESVSGRARELREKGFYFLKYHPRGSKPSDVWDVIPEDTQGRADHFAPFPEDLCKIPILATCPSSGVVLDPFCGTGTAMLAAKRMGRKSVGIDLSPGYIEIARNRCSELI